MSQTVFTTIGSTQNYLIGVSNKFKGKHGKRGHESLGTGSEPEEGPDSKLRHHPGGSRPSRLRQQPVPHGQLQL